MSLKLLPQESRPREKLLARGAESLSDAELLAIFLRTGLQGMNAIELADYLLKKIWFIKSIVIINSNGFLCT